MSRVFAALSGGGTSPSWSRRIDALAMPPVDGVVGRFVLMHQPAPAAVLDRAARLVRAGGVVAIMESHLDALVPEWHSWPPRPPTASCST